MNNCQVTYIITTNIDDCMSISCNHFASSWNIKLFNHLPAIVVVIGRSTHRIAGIIACHILLVNSRSLDSRRPQIVQG